MEEIGRARPRPLMSPEAAATVLGVTPRTLQLWRSEHRGPSYHRVGGVRGSLIRYAPDDLDAYLAATRLDPAVAPGHARRLV
jgi:hypothetical protein